jgi:hypothetical protein
MLLCNWFKVTSEEPLVMVRIGAAAFDGVDRHGRINPEGSEMRDELVARPATPSYENGGRTGRHAKYVARVCGAKFRTCISSIMRCRRSVIESSCARWNGMHMQPPRLSQTEPLRGPELSGDEPDDASIDR